MRRHFVALISMIALAVAAIDGCGSRAESPQIGEGGVVRPFVLQSNAPSPSPWQTEPDIGPPIVGSDGVSMWGFSYNPFDAVRLDIATNTIQKLPITGPAHHAHAGPGGNLWFCGPGGVGNVSSKGIETDYPEPISNCFGITTGSDGNQWLTDATSVDRVTTSGVLTRYDIAGVSVLASIASDAKNGLVWFEYDANNGCSLGTIDPNTGTYTLLPPTEGCISGGDLYTGIDGNAYTIPVYSRRPHSIIARFTPSGKITRFALSDRAFNDGTNVDENVSTVWYACVFTLCGWTVNGHQQVQIAGGSLNGHSDPVVGPDTNIWFVDGVYLRRLLSVAPQGATLNVGGQQAFQITETNCPQCVWSAQSSDSGVASVSPVTSGGFTLSAVSTGSATIVVSDKHHNAVQVPITVQ